MVEAAVALIIALVAFAVGYGNLQEKVKSNKQISDDRYNHAIKEIDMLKDSNDDTKKLLTDIQVSLKGLQGDVHYIKKGIDKLEDK